MNKKNALLVYPEFATSFWSFKFTLQYLGKKSSMPSLGLLTLASMFPKDYTLRLGCDRSTPNELCRLLPRLSAFRHLFLGHRHGLRS